MGKFPVLEAISREFSYIGHVTMRNATEIMPNLTICMILMGIFYVQISIIAGGEKKEGKERGGIDRIE